MESVVFQDSTIPTKVLQAALAESGYHITIAPEAEDAPTLSLEEALGPREDPPKPRVPDISIKPPTMKLSKELR